VTKAPKTQAQLEDPLGPRVTTYLSIFIAFLALD
jgi:hypothetical protein